jgi:ADP-heptose:LPS heptosyltransferase
MNFLLAPGIGDVTWAFFKIQSVAKKYNSDINVKIACEEVNLIATRSLDFIKRFDFINSVELQVFPTNNSKHSVILKPNEKTNKNGIYRYINNGETNKYKDIDFVLIANGSLERGIALDNWFPEYKINWNIMEDHYSFTKEELNTANELKNEIGEYVVFYLGPLTGNSKCGANKDALWKPEDWERLGEYIYKKHGYKIVLVGASYDLTYYNKYLKKHIKNKKHWVLKIGSYEINQTFAICKKSKFVISYPSGIGIVSHYLNVPTCIFNRPKGNSWHNSYYVSFKESMADAWAYPNSSKNKRFLSAIYTKDTAESIFNFVDNNWC